jgi:hypothetical protein
MPLPLTSLRFNLATRAVPVGRLPAVAGALLDALPREAFDPAFQGQALATTYFDTAEFDLRKARARGAKYLTLRLRCYGTGDDRPEVYALSAKTEDSKWRVEVEPEAAHFLLTTPADLVPFLPGDLAARLLELAGGRPLLPVVTVRCRRYAVEDDRDRLTLDADVTTDTGKCLPYGVLEFKSTARRAAPPGLLASPQLRPLKISKFLWATGN